MSPRIFLSKQAQNTTAMQKVQQKCSLKFAECTAPAPVHTPATKLNTKQDVQLGGGKHMIPSILEQILMLWHNIRHSAKEIKHFDEIWPSYLTFEIL